jgi:hypothetical protein
MAIWNIRNPSDKHKKAVNGILHDAAHTLCKDVLYIKNPTCFHDTHINVI